MFRTNIDKEHFREKPQAEYGLIRNRLYRKESSKEMTVEDLSQAIENGQTLTAAVMETTKKSGWKEQSLIVVDIDNDSGEKDASGNHIPIEEPLTPKEALDLMRENGIEPSIMYNTWSSSAGCPRFRIILILSQSITDQAKAESLGKKFVYMFNRKRAGSADRASSETDRMYTGSKKGSVFMKSASETNIETLERLPDPPEQLRPQREYKKPEYIKGGWLEDMERALRDRIDNFDLAGWISSNTNSRELRDKRGFFDPCPICGHNGCFNVTGAVYHCFSDHHTGGKKGGSIIEFLQEYNNMTYGEARDYFKYEICGQSKEEWIKAFKEEKKLQAATKKNVDTVREYDKMNTQIYTYADTDNNSSINTGAEEQNATPQEAPVKESAADYLDDFIDGITARANTPAQTTGFSKLDEVLDGGLYEGLYFIGAITSLGKTTLALQIADQIAESGKDVLIISLEMARTELMSKSISRHTILDVIKDPEGIYFHAKTNRGITDGTRWKHYSREEIALIDRSIKAYAKYAGHIYIHEGIGDIGAEQVRELTKKLKDRTGSAPVVLIDYIQILAPHNEKATDKQNIDKNVLELKRISRDFKTPVIGISSFNRDNYEHEVSLKSFKESGAIEYGSDVLMGLQLRGAGSDNFNVIEAKQKDPREVELVILKNRNGRTGDKVCFHYYPLFNYFQEFGSSERKERKRY